MSGRVPEVKPILRRVPGAIGYIPMVRMSRTGYVHARSQPENRTEGSSNFSYAGPFNEMVMLGVLAMRLQGLNKTALECAENGVRQYYSLG